MIGITNADPHFWAPNPSVVEALCASIPDGAKVLEIGPGLAPFPRAQVFVDIKDFGTGLKTVNCDVNTEPLPFETGEFDFIYARHVLEDMWNPFNLLREAGRVAKAGYFETPSPLCEFARGVDGGSPPWRGYHHHTWLIWPTHNTLYFLQKWPLIEHVTMPQAQEQQYLQMLRGGDDMWNTRFHWNGPFGFKHVQCPQDYHLPHDYLPRITAAISDWHKDLKQTLSQPCPWRK